MAVNKVIYNTENGAETLIDLTGDTVTPETLAVGATAHNASGEVIVGTMVQGNDVTIPDYWESHLQSKISTIKALQDEGGKDCFSFIVMADMHYPANLGKLSPVLAKEILDKCDIRYALCLGDVQSRGCHATKELLLAENEQIEEMLSPIRKRLLQTQGNHDGNYGVFNGANYVHRITPQEMHSCVYRKVGLVGDVHFDESGSGYYIDDIANKVRYIVLNTHNTAYELNEDGTQKYPNFYRFRFCQSQYDLVIEALNSIPSDSWAVVMAGHVSLGTNGGYAPWGDGTTAGADCYLMENLLSAYKNKTSFSGEFTGTAEGGASYTNLAEPLPNNTTDATKWVNGYRISSSGVSAQSGKTVTNPILIKTGDVIRVKGVSFVANVDRMMLTYEGADKGAYMSGSQQYVSALPASDVGYVLNGDVHEFTIINAGSTFTHFRCAFTTPTDASQVIITVNEEIVEGSVGGGYDAVSVNTDFTNAKGELVGFFGGHTHFDSSNQVNGVNRITTRCDAKEENDQTLNNERVAGTITEQSFDVFTVNKAKRKIYATKIGAGNDREISY